MDITFTNGEVEAYLPQKVNPDQTPVIIQQDDKFEKYIHFLNGYTEGNMSVGIYTNRIAFSSPAMHDSSNYSGGWLCLYMEPWSLDELHQYFEKA